MWPGDERPSYEEITALAEQAPPFTSFIDPDDERFLRPGDLPARVRSFCAETGQRVPQDAGSLFRVLFESLALRYATAVEELAEVADRRIEAIHVIGGGAKNKFLSQLTAGATGRIVRAGPVEATAIGNIVVQAIVAGELANIAEARALIRSSFPRETYEPAGEWDEARARFERMIKKRRATLVPDDPGFPDAGRAEQA